MAAYIGYLLVVIIASIVMTVSGFDIHTWQHWVMMLVVMVSNILGKETPNGR